MVLFYSEIWYFKVFSVSFENVDDFIKFRMNLSNLFKSLFLKKFIKVVIKMFSFIYIYFFVISDGFSRTSFQICMLYSIFRKWIYEERILICL